MESRVGIWGFWDFGIWGSGRGRLRSCARQSVEGEGLGIRDWGLGAVAALLLGAAALSAMPPDDGAERPQPAADTSSDDEPEGVALEVPPGEEDGLALEVLGSLLAPENVTLPLESRLRRKVKSAVVPEVEEANRLDGDLLLDEERVPQSPREQREDSSSHDEEGGAGVAADRAETQPSEGEAPQSRDGKEEGRDRSGES